MRKLRLVATLGAFIIVPIASPSLAGQAVAVPRPSVAPESQPVGPRREALERRFRERSAEIVRRQLQLNNDQMTRLQVTNQQFDRQRVALFAEERQTRQALRTELIRRDSANQQKVAGLLDQLMRLERQRLDLVASEQRELAKFLTPVQRAKYFGLQNQLRRRMQELRDRGGPAAGRRAPPMGRPDARRDIP